MFSPSINTKLLSGWPHIQSSSLMNLRLIYSSTLSLSSLIHDRVSFKACLLQRHWIVNCLQFFLDENHSSLNCFLNFRHRPKKLIFQAPYYLLCSPCCFLSVRSFLLTTCLGVANITFSLLSLSSCSRPFLRPWLKRLLHYQP